MQKSSILKEPKKVFMVDDHPAMIVGYRTLIEISFPETDFTFHSATNCEKAFNTIKDLKKEKETIDVALFDLSLPVYEKEKLFSGLDLGLFLKKEYPKAKIVIVTHLTESLVLRDVLQKLQPDAIICKTDMPNTIFETVFKAIFSGTTYLSETIQQSINFSLLEQLKIDQLDLQILFYLRKGFKTKDLPNYITLSLSAIEKRKANLKFNLIGRKGSDRELLEKAKMLKLS